MGVLNTKNPLKATVIFGMLSVLKSGVSILLLPIFLNFLSPQDYGTISLVMIYATIVTTVFSFGLKSALYTFYFDFDSKTELRIYLRNLFTAHLFFFLLTGILHLALGDQIFKTLFNSGKLSFFHYGLIPLLATFFSALNGLYFIYLKNEVDLRSYFWYTIGLTVLTAFFQLLFVVVFDLGIYGFLLGSLLPNTIIFMVIAYYNQFLFSLKLEKKVLKPSLEYGLKLLPFLLFFAFENQIDQYLIELNLGLKQVGLYAITIKLFGLLGMVTSALDDGIRPFIYRDLKHTTKTTNQYFNLYAGLGILTLAVINVIGYNLQYIISNTDYLIIKQYLFLGSLVFILLIPIRFYGLLLVFYKESSKLSVLTIVKVAVMILLMMVFIPKYGIKGALYALAISNLINVVFFGAVLGRRIFVRPDIRTVLYTLLFVAGSYWLANNINTTNETTYSLMYVVLLTFLFFVFYFRNGYSMLKLGTFDKLD